jgi:hypothetical protein
MLVCVLSYGGAAVAHVRVPDFSRLDRNKELRERTTARAPVESSFVSRDASRNGKQGCNRWEAGHPFAAFAGFTAARDAPAAVPFVAVSLASRADPSAPSDGGAVLDQILSLIDDLGTTSDVVEIAEGTTRDGISCPLYVSIGDGARKQTFWRFAPQDEPEGWFDETGRRLGGAPLGQPKPGSRVSSTFGPRRYYGRLTGGGFHDGIDFEARVGEPVYAAADGVIDHEGWYFEYGLTIKIRHAPQFTTLYAHLSKFAHGLTLGAAVRKGDLIGFIGMTGRSTGAHLHFSAIANGKFVDPAPYLSDKRERWLTGPNLASFRAWQQEIEAMVAAARRDHAPPRRELEWTTRT